MLISTLFPIAVTEKIELIDMMLFLSLRWFSTSANRCRDLSQRAAICMSRGMEPSQATKKLLERKQYATATRNSE
jgi:hypothetical protein